MASAHWRKKGMNMLTDILVHMDRGAGCTARLMATIELARQHGARVKGLYVITHPHYSSSSDYLADFSQVRDFFINATSKAGVPAEWLMIDWGQVGTPLHTIITRHAYYNDVTLIGQPLNPKNRKPDLDFYESLFLTSGRPVIVFPASGELFRFGNRIMIAWKGGRESVRTVHDALPLLQKALQVSMVAITPNKTEQLHEEQAMTELQTHLGRHGIQVTTEAITTTASLGETLLAHALQTQADLLVLGAFAYNIHSTPVLSPLVRELLVKAPLPLFVSH
jgi:nucleotide-binding universal stress UspA family protein